MVTSIKDMFLKLSIEIPIGILTTHGPLLEI